MRSTKRGCPGASDKLASSARNARASRLQQEIKGLSGKKCAKCAGFRLRMSRSKPNARFSKGKSQHRAHISRDSRHIGSFSATEPRETHIPRISRHGAHRREALRSKARSRIHSFAMRHSVAFGGHAGQHCGKGKQPAKRRSTLRSVIPICGEVFMPFRSSAKHNRYNGTTA